MILSGETRDGALCARPGELNDRAQQARRRAETPAIREERSLVGAERRAGVGAELLVGDLDVVILLKLRLNAERLAQADCSARSTSLAARCWFKLQPAASIILHQGGHARCVPFRTGLRTAALSSEPRTLALGSQAEGGSTNRPRNSRQCHLPTMFPQL